MKVMLDTDITSYIFTHRTEQVRRRFLAFSVGDVAISAITAGELVFGFQITPSERIRRAVKRALEALVVAHAISLGIPLANNNLRAFRRVPGLRVENWLA
jgi:tRNA(fMet)-specific endonuclease VapC